MTETQAQCDAPVTVQRVEILPAYFREYLIERKRALITELRQVQVLLGEPQTVPTRQRPR